MTANSHTFFAKMLTKKRLLGRAAEIGVSNGGFSKEFLHEWRGKEMFLIDRWEFDPGSHDYAAIGNEAMSKRYMKVLYKFQNDRRAIVMRMESGEAGKVIDDTSLDFVFIDADHKYEPVKRDLRIWVPKVKSGGIVAGHDWQMDDVRLAVKEHAKETKVEPTIVPDDAGGCPSWYYVKP